MASAPDKDGERRLAALTALRDLLLEERAALAARDRAAIHDCAERKGRVAAEVDALIGPGDALGRLPPEERQHVEPLARECAELNRANGVTVAALRGVVERALGILRGGEPEETTVYGPAGERARAAFGRYAGSA